MKFSTRDLYGKIVCAGRCVVRARRRFNRALVSPRELCEAVYLYCPPEEAEEQQLRLFHNYCIGVGDASWSESDRADSAVRFLVNALFSPDAAAWLRRIQGGDVNARDGRGRTPRFMHCCVGVPFGDMSHCALASAGKQG